jgi:ring-1,2-phenylacetyl-CoA epoxidase subunit PaaA
MAWKIKMNTNDELRQKFVDQTVPQAEYLGLTVPDPDLTWNEEKAGIRLLRARLVRVLRRAQGQRPLQHRTLAARNKAWDDGKWVRDGLLAHAEKKAARARSRQNRLAPDMSKIRPNGPCGKSSSAASTA